MRFSVLIAVAIAVLAAVSQKLAAAPGQGVAPKGPLNTLVDVSDAIQGCWKWPPLSEVRHGIDLTIRLSFRSNGEIFGAKLTYVTRNVPADDQALYHQVLLDALRRCSPLPVSETLGAAIAGRPFTFRFNDNRKERKA